MIRINLLPLGISFLLACSAGFAQNIKQTPVQMTSPASGVEMFKAYCAACHGVDGTGNGPAAAAMKKTPSNLTQLTQKNGGKYPELVVYEVIKGDTALQSHGSNDMPIWGQVFKESVSHGEQTDVQMRIANLTSYIKTLQAR